MGEGKDFSGLENIMTDPKIMPKLRPLVQDLDSLPFSDRDIFYIEDSSGKSSLNHFFIDHTIQDSLVFYIV